MPPPPPPLPVAVFPGVVRELQIVGCEWARSLAGWGQMMAVGAHITYAAFLPFSLSEVLQQAPPLTCAASGRGDASGAGRGRSSGTRCARWLGVEGVTSSRECVGRAGRTIGAARSDWAVGGAAGAVSCVRLQGWCANCDFVGCELACIFWSVVTGEAGVVY